MTMPLDHNTLEPPNTEQWVQQYHELAHSRASPHLEWALKQVRGGKDPNTVARAMSKRMTNGLIHSVTQNIKSSTPEDRDLILFLLGVSNKYKHTGETVMTEQVEQENPRTFLNSLEDLHTVAGEMAEFADDIHDTALGLYSKQISALADHIQRHVQILKMQGVTDWEIDWED